MSNLTILLLILLTEIVNKHNYAFMQRKHAPPQGMIFLPLSSVHVAIITGGDGLGGLSLPGIRNAVLCPRR